jgi:hypothetical protein
VVRGRRRRRRRRRRRKRRKRRRLSESKGTGSAWGRWTRAVRTAGWRKALPRRGTARFPPCMPPTS